MNSKFNITIRDGRKNVKMKKGNVLVIGNSGVGKSTLINAVLGEEVARTSYGTKGTTPKLDIYESEKIPFRLIDTIGFEPGFLQKNQAINAVKDWSKDCAKVGKEDTGINVIWFCVEGTSSKLFPDTIHNLFRATAMWRSIPIIVAITKSYSELDRKKNIQMVENAFADKKIKRYSPNLKGIIPVVAKTFSLNATAYAPPEGIGELIEITNSLLPEGIRAAQKDLFAFKLKRKRIFAQSVVCAITASAAAVGAVPIPIPDGTILTPLEIAEVKSLRRIYEIKNSNQLTNSIIEAGTVGSVAKNAINLIKAIPGLNLAAAALNSIIAASFVVAIGEGAIYIFEQVYLGNKKADDIDWVKQVIESRLVNDFVEKVNAAIQKVGDKTDKESIIQAVLGVFKFKQK